MFGKLENQQFIIEEEKLLIIKKHLAQFPVYAPNIMMINRLQKALDNQQTIYGADASFYFHEIREASLMVQGYTYNEAHQQALKDYEVSPFSVYHPDVIKAHPDEFNQKWQKAWGII